MMILILKIFKGQLIMHFANWIWDTLSTGLNCTIYPLNDFGNYLWELLKS